MSMSNLLYPSRRLHARLCMLPGNVKPRSFLLPIRVQLFPVKEAQIGIHWDSLPNIRCQNGINWVHSADHGQQFPCLCSGAAIPLDEVFSIPRALSAHCVGHGQMHLVQTAFGQLWGSMTLTSASESMGLGLMCQTAFSNALSCASFSSIPSPTTFPVG